MSGVSNMIQYDGDDISGGISIRVAGRARGGITWGESVPFCDESLKKYRRQIAGVAERSNII